MYEYEYCTNITAHLQKKSFMKNFIFCAVYGRKLIPLKYLYWLWNRYKNQAEKLIEA